MCTELSAGIIRTNSSIVSEIRPRPVTRPSARTFSNGMMRHDRERHHVAQQRHQHRPQPRDEGADDSLLAVAQPRIFLVEEARKELHRMACARRDHDKRRQQCRRRKQHRAEEQPVKPEAHQRAQQRHPQRQQDSTQRAEAVPQDQRDDQNEGGEGGGDIAQPIAVDPADNDRRARGAQLYSGTLVLLQYLVDRMVDRDRFGGLERAAQLARERKSARISADFSSLETNTPYTSGLSLVANSICLTSSSVRG